MTTRQALVVRGGWDGHRPVEATDRFVPFLRENGFAVTVSDDLAVYADAALLARTDLVVQCWSMGAATEEQIAGLVAAVRAGTGLAGWHGGIVDAFRASPPYLQLVGGQFAEHPGGFVDHAYSVVAERADHPVVAGLSTWEHAHGAVLDALGRAERRAGDDDVRRVRGHAVAARRGLAGGVHAAMGRRPGVRVDDRAPARRPRPSGGARADRTRPALGGRAS